MVLRQLLGIVDMLGAISFAAVALGHPLPYVQAAAAFALIVKGALFITDVVSVLDIIVGVVLFMLFWYSWPTLAVALAIYLGFKGIISLF